MIKHITESIKIAFGILVITSIAMVVHCTAAAKKTIRTEGAIILQCEENLAVNQLSAAFTCLDDSNQAKEACAVVGGIDAAIKLIACVANRHLNGRCVNGCPFHEGSNGRTMDRRRNKIRYCRIGRGRGVSACSSRGSGSVYNDCGGNVGVWFNKEEWRLQ